jgi:hypothetical protein
MEKVRSLFALLALIGFCTLSLSLPLSLSLSSLCSNAPTKEEPDATYLPYVELQVEFQWAVLKSLARYVEAYYLRTDVGYHEKRMKNYQVSQTMRPWMKEKDVEYMLHARSNADAWSAIKTRGSKSGQNQYLQWLATYNTSAFANAPTEKEHELGLMYVRHGTFKHLKNTIKARVQEGLTFSRIPVSDVKAWAYILFDALHFNLVDSMLKIAQLFNTSIRELRATSKDKTAKTNTEKGSTAKKTRGVGRKTTMLVEAVQTQTSPDKVISQLLLNGSPAEKQARFVFLF